MVPNRRLPLAQARARAERVAAELAPLCAQIAIAGSIRRGRAEVGDIDLVCTPMHAPVLRARLARHCKIETNGAQNIIARMQDGFQLDVYLARPEEKDLLGYRTPGNFGTLLVCRTGSKEFNIWLASRAGEMGLHWDPYRGVMDGNRLLGCETEEQVFAALKTPWVKPESRER